MNCFSQTFQSYAIDNAIQPDTNVKKSKNVSIAGIFLSIGGGLGIPLQTFKETASPTFGALARLEYSSTSIFPLVIGVEADIFSYNAPDEFKTINVINGFKTKIFSYGLNIEYNLTRILKSSYTMPFITIDVKNNSVKREYDDDTTFASLPRKETKISFGGGFGFTLFVFDFYVKYNYMKNFSNVSVYTKFKIPIIRF